MTQVSRIPLNREIENRVFDLFLDSVAEVKTRKDVIIFLTDLLSPTEKIMLAKRLSIAFLLHKGYEQRTISNILKVSLTTVSKISGALQSRGDGYRRVIERIVTREKREAFWQKIDDAITELMLPASRNWSLIRKQQYRDKIAQRKAF